MPVKAIDRKVQIPIHHDYVAAKKFYLSRKDFFTGYEMSEPNEIGCVFDPKTGKPIMRIVCDIEAQK